MGCCIQYNIYCLSIFKLFDLIDTLILCVLFLFDDEDNT